MKRFYKVAAAFETPEGYQIHLDGKPIRTPASELLLIPIKNLADLSVLEWNAQKDIIDSEAMPVTQITVMAIEQVAPRRPAIEKNILNYLNTDLLCYRAQEPRAIAERQQKAWDPWLKWFQDASGVILLTTTGLQAMEQPQKAKDFLAVSLQSMNLWQLTAMQVATALGGSAILALAFVAGDADAEDIFKAAHVEEDYRAEVYNESFYGSAPHQEKSQAAFRRDLAACRQILAATQNSA